MNRATNGMTAGFNGKATRVLRRAVPVACLSRHPDGGPDRADERGASDRTVSRRTPSGGGSERARWALDHHRIAYRQEAHIPVLGERKLRRIVGPTKPRATVPVLVTRDGVIDDSWEIALYADRVGAGTKLVPDPHREAVEHWVKQIDEAMGVARAVIVAKTLASPGALDEASPAPTWLRPALRPLARRALRTFAKKYALDLGARGLQLQAVRAILEKLRGALGGRDTLLLELTYADVVAATLMQSVSPVDDRRIRLPPATRAVWTDDELAREFSDLVLWRDRLYEKHRGSRVRDGSPPDTIHNRAPFASATARRAVDLARAFLPTPWLRAARRDAARRRKSG